MIPSTHLTDNDPRGDVDAALALLSRTRGMPVIVLARVDNSEWVVLAAIDNLSMGMDRGFTLPARDTYCSGVARGHGALVIADAADDPRYRTHRAFRRHGVQSYVGVPYSLAGGVVIGTLCALDRRARVGLETVLRDFALVAHFLETAVRPRGSSSTAKRR
jgi:GAF domain-containing protein